MRILHCIPSMEGGGAERQLTYLASGLADLGWEVHVAMLRRGVNVPRLERAGAIVHRLPVANNHDPRLVTQVASLVRRTKAQVVQTWLLQMDVGAALAAMLTRTPVVITERSCESAYPPSFKASLRKFVARGAQAIVANSAGGHSYWDHLKGPVPRRLVIPNALPLDEIAAAPVADSRRYDIPAAERVILYAGRFSEEKNLDRLVLALKDVLAGGGARAVLCGEGPMRAHVGTALSNAGLSDAVLPGYVDDLWSWMKRADVFVSVGLFEGHPNTVLEALACGCRIVASDIGAHREFLDDEVADIVDPADVRSIAAGLRRALSMPPEAAARRSGLARARAARWALPAIARQYDDLYRQVLAGVNKHVVHAST